MASELCPHAATSIGHYANCRLILINWPRRDGRFG